MLKDGAKKFTASRLKLKRDYVIHSKWEEEEKCIRNELVNSRRHGWDYSDGLAHFFFSVPLPGLGRDWRRWAQSSVALISRFCKFLAFPIENSNARYKYLIFPLLPNRILSLLSPFNGCNHTDRLV